MILKVLNALIGYAGSSEDPGKMSMRFMAVLVAVSGKILGLLAAAGYVLPFSSADVQSLVGAMVMVAAAIMWIIGAVRAVINAFKQAKSG